MEVIEDELWRHFKPLWKDLSSIGQGLLIAGGYGLFLKQQWLLAQENPSIVIPLNRWSDATPRVTKDLDLVVGLDFIADEITNRQLFNVLDKHEFKVSERLQGKRWQFVKELEDGKSVITELHTQAPKDGASNLSSDRIRVKHKPSLGEEGVHGRLNSEAVGIQLHPCCFLYDDTEITVPNPLTWSIMKLTAANDQWSLSQDIEQEEEGRSFARAQAIKHGQDVCRAVAMMSANERDTASDVLKDIRATPQYIQSSSIYNGFFAGTNDWANQVLANLWISEDLETIQKVLQSWFLRQFPDVNHPQKFEG